MIHGGSPIAPVNESPGDEAAQRMHAALAAVMAEERT